MPSDDFAEHDFEMAREFLMEWPVASAYGQFRNALAALLTRVRREAVEEWLDNPDTQLGTAVRLLTSISAYWEESGVTRPHLAEFVDAFFDGDYAKAEPLPWPRDKDLPYLPYSLRAIRERGRKRDG